MKLILPLFLLSLLALSSCETTQMDVSTGNARVSYMHRGAPAPAPAPAAQAPRPAAAPVKPAPAVPASPTRQNQPELTPPPAPVKAAVKPAPATPAPQPKVTKPTPPQPKTSPTRQNQPELTPPPAKPAYSGSYATIHSSSGQTTAPQQKSTRKRVLMPGQNRGLKTR